MSDGVVIFTLWFCEIVKFHFKISTLHCYSDLRKYKNIGATSYRVERA